MTNVSAPQEGFKGFANARQGWQHCESFAIHIEQVWLMDQVATPLWSEKGDRDMTQMHERHRVEEEEEERAGTGRAGRGEAGLRSVEMEKGR